MSDFHAWLKRFSAWQEGGCVGPKPVMEKGKPPEAPTIDVDCGDEWRELAPASQRAYRRLRLIEKRARRGHGGGGGGLTATDHEWMASETGETPEERSQRLHLMWRERSRA